MLKVFNVKQIQNTGKKELQFNLYSDNEIFIAGGMKLNGNPCDQFTAYNVEDDTWRSLPRMPTERYATFSFLIDNKFYNMGNTFIFRSSPSMRKIKMHFSKRWSPG